VVGDGEGVEAGLFRRPRHLDDRLLADELRSVLDVVDGQLQGEFHRVFLSKTLSLAAATGRTKTQAPRRRPRSAGV
jgi:hypothetical protein